ncbi:MAG: hypothetical protein P8105_04310 [Dehalococcoidia bacterium]
MEITIEKTWKPVAGGVLSIIAGVFSLIGCIVTISLIGVVGSSYIWDYTGLDPVSAGVVQTVLVIVSIVTFITGILPLIGGIYSLQRKRWGLALAGSITAIIGTTILGILSVIFIAMAKNEFE